MKSRHGSSSPRRCAPTLLVAVSICCVLSTECRHHESGFSQLRIVDAVPDGGRIVIGVPGSKAQARLAFGQELPYERVPAGIYRTSLVAEQSGTAELRPLAASSLTIAAKRRYTAIALGVLEGKPPAALHLFEESPSVYPLKNTQTLVRVINAAPDAGPVDVLFDNLATFKNLPFDGMSSASALPAARYACTVKMAGERFTPLNGPKQIALKGGKAYLLVVLGRKRDETISIVAYED